MAPKFNNCPRNAWIVIIFSMYIESYSLKYILKGIWWQMKFGEVFWGEVSIDALKRRRGMQANNYTIFLLSGQIVKATSGYYKMKNKYPNV